MNADDHEEQIRYWTERARHYRVELVSTSGLLRSALVSDKSCLCFVRMEDNTTAVHAGFNQTPFFGKLVRGGKGSSNFGNVKDLFGSPQADAYFDAIGEMTRYVRSTAMHADKQPWKRIYPLTPGESGLKTWIPSPADQWKINLDSATVIADSPSGGHYLTSPHELIGKDEDFRIEYTARANAEPRDLSVIVGNAGTEEITRTDGVAYESLPGYSFVFGGVANCVSELRRNGMTSANSTDALITKGHDHRCVAERIGGVLRFEVDGKEVFNATDALPFCLPGYGNITFYTWAGDHMFRDISVSTRPTCITGEILERMDNLRHVVLEAHNMRARYVEVSYMGESTYISGTAAFMFKDVTEVIEERMKHEAERREAEKLEALLNLAGAAAHELNQPLTTIIAYLGILDKQPSEKWESLLQQYLPALQESSDLMAKIIKNISHINKYQTKQYVGDSQILDIEASSEPESSQQVEPDSAHK